MIHELHMQNLSIAPATVSEVGECVRLLVEQLGGFMNREEK
jgi:hypothetical protein